MSDFWNANIKQDEDKDPEVIAERERRRRERGKKRYEQDYSFVNDEFFSSWKNRTSNFSSSNGATRDSEMPLEAMWNGADLNVDIEIAFDEVLQIGGITKDVRIAKQVLCSSCNGTRERAGSLSLPCYSCKGEGLKVDGLFHKQTRCNTCKGHGKLIQSECQSCKGAGLEEKLATVKVKFEQFTQDGSVVELVN